MKPYRLNSSAVADLQDIVDYLLPAPDEIRTHILDEIEHGFQQAADYPESGLFERRLTARFGEPVRSLLVYPDRIFYLPAQSPLTIFAVIHGKRDPLTVLESR